METMPPRSMVGLENLDLQMQVRFLRWYLYRLTKGKSVDCGSTVCGFEPRPVPKGRIVQWKNALLRTT